MTRSSVLCSGAAALVILSACLTGCSSDHQHLLTRLKAFAGPGALSCGDTLFDGLVRKNNACAIGAATEATPFYIRWSYEDGPSTRTRGIAMNGSGQMIMISPTPNSSTPDLVITYCLKKRLMHDPDIVTQQVLTCD